MTTLTSASARALGPAIGAEVRGIDLREPLSPSQVTTLWDLVLAHKVVFFPGQALDSDAQIAFAQHFGTLTSAHPVVAPVDDSHPEVWQIDSYQEVRNDEWHTDVTFVERPPLAGILRAISVPEVGGDTSWTDLEAAYQGLSKPIQDLIDGLTAIHDGSREFSGILAQREGAGNVWDGEVFTGFAGVEHPVVRVHPETGRKSLFVNPGFTVAIKGLSRVESSHLLELLYAQFARPEHQVRHRWTAGDLVVWDNRNTAHYANFDYGDFRRIMQRVTLGGDRPVGPQDRS